MRPKFKFINRSFNKTLFFLPGWATDYRIFAPLDLDYNYIFPFEFSPFTISQDIPGILESLRIKKVCLFGWSMGAFLAADYAIKNPALVEELIMVSIRKRFPLQALSEIAEKIKFNKRAYLHKFYSEVFSPYDTQGLNWFKQALEKYYIDKFNKEELLAGLDYLKGARISARQLSALENIKVLQGGLDTICPLNEAAEVISQIPQAEFICLKNCGHIPFLNPEFKDRL
ncbi:MAG: alpha/beta hydrolase [Candidatus Omnitrophota bacterium]